MAQSQKPSIFWKTDTNTQRSSSFMVCLLEGQAWPRNMLMKVGLRVMVSMTQLVHGFSSGAITPRKEVARLSWWSNSISIDCSRRVIMGQLV